MEKSDYMDRLILLLAEIDFACRYYDIYEALPKSNLPVKFSLDDYSAAIDSVTNMKFHYYKKEKFFGAEEFWGTLPVKFNIALYHHSAIEFILGISTPTGYVGGPFHGLAHKVAVLNQPDFSYSPRYPRLPFTSLEEMHSVLCFGLEMYKEIKSSLKNDSSLFLE